MLKFVRRLLGHTPLLCLFVIYLLSLFILGASF
jgi:hypothetical protein